jgi:hypothetical protein
MLSPFSSLPLMPRHCHADAFALFALRHIDAAAFFADAAELFSLPPAPLMAAGAISPRAMPITSARYAPLIITIFRHCFAIIFDFLRFRYCRFSFSPMPLAFRC